MKLYELKKNQSCKKHRSFAYHATEQVGDHVVKSRMTIQACLDLIAGYPEADVKKRFHEGFEALNYPTQLTRDAEEDQAWKEVRRYVSAELSVACRRVIPPKPMLVDIGAIEEVFVQPDFITVGGPFFDNIEKVSYDGVINVIKLHAGKNQSTVEETKNDLAKFAMLKYGRKLVSPGKRALIVAKDIFLKRKDDVLTGEKPCFKNEFYAIGGNNETQVTETYVGGSASTDTEARFKPLVDDFNEGHDAEDCSEKECKACPLYDLCHYAEPPIALKKEHVQKTIRDISLTASQEEAIEYEQGIVRINAGAGVGKTVVVALRTVTLLNKGVKPEEIVLMTFTNAGAEEMKSRIQLYNDDIGTGEDISAMKVCTFNSFGDDILKEEYGQFGFTEPPKVVDDVERAGIISELLKNNIINGLNYKQFVANTKYCKGAVWIAARVFDIMKKGPYTAADVDKVWNEMGMDRRFAPKTAIEELVKLYDEYDNAMRENNLIEFADQEMMLFELLQRDPYYLERFGYKHIIVDEFQDSNERQINLLQYLISAPTFESLMVVGDDSQSIFSFRNTSPEYIINFSQYIGEATDDIFLLENHRCTPEIIDFANKINEKNTFKVAKDLIATRPHGAPVVVKGFHELPDEEEFIVGKIKDKLAAGTKPEDIAIICSTKNELRKFADRLTKEGIPSISLNPEPYLENSRVRAAIAYIKALTSDIDTHGMMVFANAQMHGEMFNKTAEEIEEAIDKVRESMEELAALPDNEKKDYLVNILQSISNEDEIYDKFLETVSRKTYDKIIDYCLDFLVFGEKNEARREHDYPGIVLTTCHSSKGLEWPIVFASLSQFDSESKGLHGTNGSTGATPASIQKVEEARRLLFVTATRARDELFVTSKYVAYGKRGNYTYNQFLRDAYDANGQKYDLKEIQAEAQEIADQKKRQRAEEKARVAAELDAIRQKALI